MIRTFNNTPATVRTGSTPLVRVWRAATDANAARTPLTCRWLPAELVELNLQSPDRDAERAVEGSVRR